MTPEEFRHHANQLIHRIAAYRAKIATRPVQSTAFPGSIRAQLPATPPAAGHAPDTKQEATK